MRIMHVAGTMQHIEHLSGLGDRAEERIIAALRQPAADDAGRASQPGRGAWNGVVR
jgi:hypothetical protein